MDTPRVEFHDDGQGVTPKQPSIIGCCYDEGPYCDIEPGTYALLPLVPCDKCKGAGTVDPSGNPGGPGCMPCPAGCWGGWQPKNGSIGRLVEDGISLYSDMPDDIEVLVIPLEGK